MLKIKNRIIISVKIIIFSAILTLGQQSIAAMDSGNYEIWLDELNSGGGKMETSNYKIDTGFTTHSGGIGQSTSFREKIGFIPIEDEPSVGFNVQSVNLDFGELSPSSTAYSSHTFSAYTNSTSGYTIRVYGQSLHNSSHTISAIGATALSSAPGIEQFGFNLASNSVPLVGDDPVGGMGQAAENYNITNKYAYNEGDVIAQSESFSWQTDFKVSVIVNIAEDTSAGNYGTVLTYEFIPVF